MKNIEAAKAALAEITLAARGRESQARFAVRVGVSDRLIGLIENKKTKGLPKPITIARLALAAGRDPVRFCEELGLGMSPERVRALEKEPPTLLLDPARSDLSNLKIELMQYIDRRCDELAASIRELAVRLDQQSEIFTKLFAQVLKNSQ